MKTFVVEIKVEQTFHFHTTQPSAEAAVRRAVSRMEEFPSDYIGVLYCQSRTIANVTLAPYERTVKLGRGETDLK